MTQREPLRQRVPSIDSALRESRQSSPRPGNTNLRNEIGERSRNILSSPWTSMSSLERIDTGQTTTTQSVDFAIPPGPDTVGRPASESDSPIRQYGTSRSQSNRSSLIRSSYQRLRSISSHDTSSTEDHGVQEEYQALRENQENIPTSSRGDGPRLPTVEELARLPSGVIASVIPPRERDGVEGLIVILHDQGGNETSLKDFAQEHLRPKHTACVLLRGVYNIEGREDSYQWENHSDTFLRTSRLLLEEIIHRYLIRECNFPPRKIIIFGHGEGAEAALLTFLRWESIEFGGVISVGGRLIAHVALPEDTKSRTPVLLLGGALGITNPTAINQIQEYFSHVDDDLLPAREDGLPSGRQLKTLKAFFAHRLQEEEWKKPATITFDGGGIKGYGSLLILKDLMNKIGEEEKRLDQKTESSFYPSMYMPRSKDSQSQDRRSGTGEGHNTQALEPSPIPIPTSTANLPNSSLFLPVHYFKYMSGTSTGGLISIMLSRLRMTVDDCLEEYRNLGSDVFGRPRLLTMKTILRDKYDWKRLHKAIESATHRHCENPHEATKWPSPEDLSSTIVVTYHDKATTEDPYLIRTFQTHSMIKRPSSMRSLAVRNAGSPQNMDIPLVGRATTAAPGYFRHLTTKIGDTTLRFKDGGFGCNNPSFETYNDVSALLANGGKDMGPFISIGTGDQDIFLFPSKQGRLRHKWSEFRAARKFPTRTKGAHENMVGVAYRGGKERFPYARFDGGKRLGAIPMDEWKPNDRTGTAIFTGKHKFSGRETLLRMEEAVTLYLAQEEVQEELKRFAAILVHRRRLQTRDESRWDRYASASWYICPHNNCNERKHDTLDGYKRHVLRYHRRLSPKELQADAQRARRCWLYRNGRPSAHDIENIENNIPESPDLSSGPP